MLGTLGTGVLPDGTRTRATPIDAQNLEDYWNARVLDSSLTGTGASRGIETPNDFLMDQFGSHGNRSPFLTLQRSLNNIKGRIFGDNVNPQAPRIFERHLNRAANSGQGEDALFQSLREVSQSVRKHPCRGRRSSAMWISFSSTTTGAAKRITEDWRQEHAMLTVELLLLDHRRVPVYEPPSRPPPDPSQSTTTPSSRRDHRARGPRAGRLARATHRVRLPVVSDEDFEGPRVG